MENGNQKKWVIDSPFIALEVYVYQQHLRPLATFGLHEFVQDFRIFFRIFQDSKCIIESCSLLTDLSLKKVWKYVHCVCDEHNANRGARSESYQM